LKVKNNIFPPGYSSIFSSEVCSFWDGRWRTWQCSQW